MKNDSLKNYYDKKYASESKLTSVECIKIAKTPTSRFEAAVKFFPKYFKGGDILEIGAGNGNIAKTLLSAPNQEILSYTLGDISQPRMEGLSKQLNDIRVKVVSIDAENIPANEHGKYDAIIMVALIEHLIDPLRAMQNISKLLKPGGFVYIDTPNIAKYTQRIKLLLGRFPSTSSQNEGLTTNSGKPVDLHDEGHLHYFTYRSLSLMLTERCEFTKVVKLSYPGGLTVLGKHIHTRLAGLWPELFSELAIIAYM